MGGKKNGASAQEKTRPEPKSGWTWRFILVMSIIYLATPALFFSMAALNSPSELIKDFMNRTEVERTGSPMPKNRTESLFGLLVAVIGVGSALGSLTATSISNTIGRKYACIVTAVVGSVGVLLMSMCKLTNSYEVLFVGRTVTGVVIGWCIAVSIPYVAELSKPAMRTKVTLVNQLLQSLALVVSQVFGYEELLGNEEMWTYLLGFPLVLMGVQLVLFIFCPESPRFLITKRENEAEARKVLQSLRCSEDVDEDIKLLYEEMEGSKLESQVSFQGLFTTPILRRPVIIAIVLGLQQDWCGMTGSLFEDIGISLRASRYATSGTGLTMLLGNILALYLISKFGRKTLFQAGTIGMGLCSAAFVLTTLYKDEVDALKYVNIVVSLLCVFCFAFGPIAVFWIMMTELFPASARTPGMSVATLCAFLSFFSHNYLFPELLSAFKEYTFFVFTALDGLIVIFVHFFVPETKNKSFQEIAQTWGAYPDKDLEPAFVERPSVYNYESIVSKKESSDPELVATKL